MGFFEKIFRFFGFNSKSDKKQQIENQPSSSTDQIKSPLPVVTAETLDVEVLNRDGDVIFAAKELNRLPAGGRNIDISSEDNSRLLNQVVGEVLKGAVNKPNRVFQVVFSPEIQKGMDVGEYALMRTNNGEFLADAVDVSSSQVVKKGRVIQSSHVKQMSVAAYQLISFAVAQSHLMDIQRSLGSINEKIDRVLDIMESDHRSQIAGGLNFLQEIIQGIESGRIGLLSIHTENQISNIISQSINWRAKFYLDFEKLRNDLKDLSDKDQWGTEKNYLNLKEIAGRFDVLITRCEVLMNFSKALGFVLMYVDPGRVKFQVGFSLDRKKWFSDLEDFEHLMNSRALDLIKSRFNSKETINLRKNNVVDGVKLGMFKGKECSNDCDRFLGLIEKELANRVSVDGVRLAVSMTGNQIRKAIVI